VSDLSTATGTDVEVLPDVDPWSVYVAAWLAAYTESAETERAYRTDARQWTTWCTDRGIDPLRAVRPHLETYAGDLRATGGHGGRGAAPKTVARKLASVASLYGYLVEEGILDHSPAQHVRRPKVGRDYAATVSLDEEQTRAVLRAARDHSPTAHAVTVTLALTGIRAAEALAADVTDLVDDHGHKCLNVRRKGGHDDRVILPPSAAHIVTRYVAARTEGPLFLDGPGERRLTYPGLRWMLERVGRAAGLPSSLHLHPHMLRASFATISFDHGVPGDRIQDALGHADPRTTRLYDRGRRRLRRKAEPGAVVARHVLDDDV